MVEFLIFSNEFTRTLLVHRNYYLSCLVADDLDGSGLQLEKIGTAHAITCHKHSKLVLHPVNGHIWAS